MKMFFTYLTATFLFSLCLLEKEARKSAVPRNNSDKNYAQLDEASSGMTLVSNMPAQLDMRVENKLVAGERSNKISFPRYILADSLNFSVGLAKQEDKVF